MIEFTDEEKAAFASREQDDEYDRYRQEEIYRFREEEAEYDRGSRAREDSRYATSDISGIWGSEH